MLRSFPPLAVDLLSRMLAVSPHDRISAAEALRHPFFLEGEGTPAPSR